MTNRRTQFVDVTVAVEEEVKASGITQGVCYLYVPHTTAGILINEHADPDVAADMEAALDRLAPRNGPDRHSEGHSDSPIKAGLSGARQGCVRRGGKTELGPW